MMKALGGLARYSSEHDGQAPYTDDLPQIGLDQVHHRGWHLINGQDRLDERTVAPGLDPIEHQIPSREGSQQTGKQSRVGIGGKLELNRLNRVISNGQHGRHFLKNDKGDRAAIRQPHRARWQQPRRLEYSFALLFEMTIYRNSVSTIKEIRRWA
jgi:hypothetical protein